MSVDAETRQRIATLERQVKALMRHTDMPAPSVTADLAPETLALIRDGKPMDAVKAIRADLNCDLAAAQQVYEEAF
jgi:hypothetical protein